MQWILFILSYIMLVTARPRRESSEDVGLEAYAPEQYSNTNSQWDPSSEDLYDLLSRIEEESDTSK